jgi:hypothetical protein
MQNHSLNVKKGAQGGSLQRVLWSIQVDEFVCVSSELDFYSSVKLFSTELLLCIRGLSAFAHIKDLFGL